MAKIVLGKRPETITAIVNIPLVSGEKAKVSCQFKYRTRQEFAKFLDENAEAKPDVGTDGEKITFESLAVKGMASNAARALEFLKGWNLDDIELTQDNLAQLFNEEPAAGSALWGAYRAACTEGYLGNSEA